MAWISAQQEKFIVENFLVIVFTIAITIALAFPFPGDFLGSILYDGKSVVQFINTFIVFFISGLTLRVEEFSNISKYTVSILYGILSINLVTTLFAPIFFHCTFLAPSFRLGLAIFSCVPTTLGVGVALTQLATGDLMLALLLTVLTNSLGTLTTPFLLNIYFSAEKSGGFHFDSIGLLINLILDVLIPTILGILLRVKYESIRHFTNQYKTSLGIFSTSNLAMIVWMALSKSRDLLLQQSLKDIIIVLISAAIMHIAYLFLNYLAAAKCGLKFDVIQTVTLVIMCSQKSNPVALAVINGMGLTHSGLVVIPGILGQLTQIFIGSFIARYFRAWIVEDQEEREKELQNEESKRLIEPTNPYYQYGSADIEEASTMLEILE